MNEGAVVQEHDFVVAMATAKGHSSPVGMCPFACKGCGASFLLGSSVLSLTCSYCGSAHVVELSEARQLISPEGLIPFNVSEQEARRAFHRWLNSKKLRGKTQVTRVRGLYLPAWTYDLSGEIRWQCYVEREESTINVNGLYVSFGSSKSRRKVREEGSHLVVENDIMIPASHKLPADLIIKEAERFELNDVVPYDEGYLADWPAEVYEISVSDASLVARRVALEKARRFVKTRVSAKLENHRDLQLNTGGVIIESFKLILLPIWVARYRHEGKVYHAIVNGQTGDVRAQEPRNWFQKLFGGLFN
jgi:hypothetical protein